MSCPQRFPVQGSPAAGISDKYFITAHRAGPRKVPAASDPAEHPFLPGQKDVAGWGVQAGSGAQKASSFPPWCHVRSAQLSSADAPQSLTHTLPPTVLGSALPWRARRLLCTTPRTPALCPLAWSDGPCCRPSATAT